MLLLKFKFPQQILTSILHNWYKWGHVRARISICIYISIYLIDEMSVFLKCILIGISHHLPSSTNGTILTYAVRRWLTLHVATSIHHKKNIFLTHREVNLLLRVWDSIKIAKYHPDMCSQWWLTNKKQPGETLPLIFNICCFVIYCWETSHPPKFSGWKQLIIISCNSLGWLGTARQSSMGLACSL